jgi:hypothetical protein
MRQKTKNDRNQGSNAKKKFFVLFPSPLPRWVRLVQKTRAKNSHAWAPLKVPNHEIFGEKVVYAIKVYLGWNFFLTVQCRVLLFECRV